MGSQAFHTFVVRYRLESTDSGAATEWRGVVVHLPGDQSLHFRDPQHLLAFIVGKLESAAGESVSDETDGR